MPDYSRTTPTCLEMQGVLGQPIREPLARAIREGGPAFSVFAFSKTFVVIAKKFQANARMKLTLSDLAKARSFVVLNKLQT